MSAIAIRRTIYLIFGGLPALALLGVVAIGLPMAILVAQDFAVLGIVSVVGVVTGWHVILAPATVERRWRAALTIVFFGLVPLSFVIITNDGPPLLKIALAAPWLVGLALLVELWQQPNRQPQDLKRFLEGLAAGFILTFILFSGRYDDSFVHGFAAELRSSDGPVDLRKHTDFDWDRVYVLLPYGDAWDDWISLGYPWLKFSLIQPKFDERDVGWVFVKDGLVTRYASVSRHDLPFPKVGQFESTDARFRITNGPPNEELSIVH